MCAKGELGREGQNFRCSSVIKKCKEAEDGEVVKWHVCNLWNAHWFTGETTMPMDVV